MLYSGSDKLVLASEVNIQAFLSSVVFVIGARDPEMERIEHVLCRIGAGYITAAINGVRCHAGNAYKADPVHTDKMLVWVECGTAEMVCPFISIDHHNEGDFGFSMGPENYWEGSSIGQLYRLLMVNGSHPAFLDTVFGDDRYLIAASDHCPAAAYKGLCTGIDPDKLAGYRAARNAEFLKMSVEEYIDGLNNSIELAKALPVMELGGEVYYVASEPIEFLNEVSLRLGITVEYVMGGNARDPRTKIGLLGGSPALTAAWMAAKEGVLVGIYGSPARGYAGGYLV